MQTLYDFHAWLNGLVWGPPMIIMLMGAGLYLTLLTGGVQFRRLGFALREVLGKIFSKSRGEGTVTPFQAVSTALASTVGVGNIVGVATAIHLGGPGALFWLFVSGLLGMATKFSEIAIALRFRERDSSGVVRGGAMYVLTRGLGMAWLGRFFALLTSLAAFGIGNMVQANSVADSLNASLGVPHFVTGILAALMAGLVVLGGIKRIAEVTQLLVPFMCLFYLIGSAVIILAHLAELPRVIQLVFASAFAGHAAVGGFAGATVREALRYGIARGLFSNEAGLGSAPIAHSAAITDHPVRQACYGIFEVFVDTILVCTATGLVILSTGAWESGLTGAALSARAFELGLPGQWGDFVVTLGVVLFAFSTILGWSFYGETGAVYLLGVRAAIPYRVLWIISIYIGAVGSLRLVWDVADTLNGLMALPNLIAVLGTSGLIRKLTREFFAAQKMKELGVRS